MRHSKRCLGDVRSVPRQKSCEQCIRAKSRCTLTRPECERCLSKRLSCRYYSTHMQHGNHDTDQLDAGKGPARNDSAFSSASSRSEDPRPLPTSDDSVPVPPQLEFSGDPGPLGRFPGLMQRAGSIQQHALHHTIRVLRTYPRMLSRRTQLPPFIHRSQIENGTLPPALKTCRDTLTKNGRHGASSQQRIMAEIVSIHKTVSLVPCLRLWYRTLI